MRSTVTTSTQRTGRLHSVGAVRHTSGLWDALMLAARDNDATENGATENGATENAADDSLAESRRRLAALRLRRATASLDDYKPCA